MIDKTLADPVSFLVKISVGNLRIFLGEGLKFSRLGELNYLIIFFFYITIRPLALKSCPSVMNEKARIT